MSSVIVWLLLVWAVSSNDFIVGGMKRGGAAVCSKDQVVYPIIIKLILAALMAFFSAKYRAEMSFIIILRQSSRLEPHMDGSFVR